MAAGLAVLASLLWGSADFLGGTVSRRLPVATVLGWSQLVALVSVLVVGGAVGDFHALDVRALWGVGAGLLGSVALLAFYRALASGTMGVVAPVSALSVAVPFSVGVGRGERPAAIALTGVVIAVAGVVVASHPEMTSREPARSSAIGLAIVAAIGFGGVTTMLAYGAAYSVSTTLVLQRATNVAVALPIVLALSGPALPSNAWMTVSLVGLGDIGANAAYAIATRHGLLSLVAVLAGLYPAVTVMLARQVHRERLSRGQLFGVGATLVGAALIALG